MPSLVTVFMNFTVHGRPETRKQKQAGKREGGRENSPHLGNMTRTSFNTGRKRIAGGEGPKWQEQRWSHGDAPGGYRVEPRAQNIKNESAKGPDGDRL